MQLFKNVKNKKPDGTIVSVNPKDEHEILETSRDEARTIKNEIATFLSEVWDLDVLINKHQDHPLLTKLESQKEQLVKEFDYESKLKIFTDLLDEIERLEVKLLGASDVKNPSPTYTL